MKEIADLAYSERFHVAVAAGDFVVIKPLSAVILRKTQHFTLWNVLKTKWKIYWHLTSAINSDTMRPSENYSLSQTIKYMLNGDTEMAWSWSEGTLCDIITRNSGPSRARVKMVLNRYSGPSSERVNMVMNRYPGPRRERINNIVAETGSSIMNGMYKNPAGTRYQLNGVKHISYPWYQFLHRTWRWIWSSRKTQCKNVFIQMNYKYAFCPLLAS